MTEHFDVSLRGIEQAQQQLDGRRFARAVRAEQAEHLARPDLEIHVIHGLGFGPAPEVFEDLRQPADDDDVFCRWRVAGRALWSFLFQGNHRREKIETTRFATWPQAAPALRNRAKTIWDFGTISPSPRPSPIGWERENRPPSVGAAN